MLVEDAQTLDLIQPLQTTFYHYLTVHGPDEAVTLVVIGCLLINVDLAFEVISSKSDIDKWVLSPLSEQRDIRRAFPGPFRSVAQTLELRELADLHATVLARQRDRVRRAQILDDCD